MAQPRRHRVLREILGAVTSESDTAAADSFAALHGSIVGLTLKPTTHGGAGQHVEQYLSEVNELAVHDASLGWLAAVFNVGALEIAGPAGHIADEVWGSDSDALIAPSFGGDGTLFDGLRLTGRWDAVVGARYADWLLLPVNGRRVLVAREAAQLEPVAHQTGLAGAGVGDVSIRGVAVAERHILPADGGRATVIAGAGAAAAVVGSADGVWRQHVQRVRARLATSHGGDEVTDQSAAQVAWAASDIDAAKLQVATSLEDSDDAGRRRACRQAVARAGAAADRLLGSSRHALDASDPVTRRWRDVHAGCDLAVRLLER
jgi:3-hydroxy-9,10-secoandrosta-1,3,5(10)-triene-9,17-dione monooxygenase